MSNDSALRDRVNHLAHAVEELDSYRHTHSRRMGELEIIVGQVRLATTQIKPMVQDLIADIHGTRADVHKMMSRVGRMEMMLEKMCVGLGIQPPPGIK